jgi:hypothetical protein
VGIPERALLGGEDAIGFNKGGTVDRQGHTERGAFVLDRSRRDGLKRHENAQRH